MAIHDGTPSTITYTTDAQGQILRRVETSSNSTNPKTFYYFFAGQQVGEVTNDGSEQVQDYAEAIAVRSAKAQEGPFANGGTSGTAYAAFGDAFQQITPTSQGSSTDEGSTYTVEAGDTLASVASKLWGDSSLWYLIADANGLSGGASLSTGQVLSIPAQVTNVHNSASTFHVYDPTQAIGDVQPLNPPPAQNSGGGCGIFGEILSIIVAVALVGPVGAAISAIVGFKAPFVPGAALAEGVEVAVGAKSSFSWQDVENVAGEASQTFKQIAVTALNVAIDVATAAVLLPLGPLGEAAGAALDSVVNQGIDIATGLQKKFSWTDVAVAAVSAGVTDGLGGYAPGASFATRAVAGAAAYVADSATEAALGQGSFGHDLEANLPGLAATTAASAALGPIDDAIGATGQAATSPLAEVGSALSGAAGAIAGAATQSALTGASFGRTLEDQLPEEIASSIGSTIGSELDQTPELQGLQQAAQSFVTPTPANPQPSIGAIIAVPDPLQPPIQLVQPQMPTDLTQPDFSGISLVSSGGQTQVGPDAGLAAEPPPFGIKLPFPLFGNTALSNEVNVSGLNLVNNGGNVAAVASDLAAIPDYIDQLVSSSLSVHVTLQDVAGDPDFAGSSQVNLPPRGWEGITTTPPGATSPVQVTNGMLPGMFFPQDNEVILSTSPFTNEGSFDMDVQAFGHGVDSVLGRMLGAPGGLISNTPGFQAAVSADAAATAAWPSGSYFSASGNAQGSSSEAFAESFADFYGRGNTGSTGDDDAGNPMFGDAGPQNAPHLYAFMQSLDAAAQAAAGSTNPSQTLRQLMGPVINPPQANAHR